MYNSIFSGHLWAVHRVNFCIVKTGSDARREADFRTDWVTKLTNCVFSSTWLFIVVINSEIVLLCWKRKQSKRTSTVSNFVVSATFAFRSFLRVGNCLLFKRVLNTSVWQKNRCWFLPQWSFCLPLKCFQGRCPCATILNSGKITDFVDEYWTFLFAHYFASKRKVSASSNEASLRY